MIINDNKFISILKSMKNEIAYAELKHAHAFSDGAALLIASKNCRLMAPKSLRIGFDTDKMQPIFADKVVSFYKKAIDNATEINVRWFKQRYYVEEIAAKWALVANQDSKDKNVYSLNQRYLAFANEIPPNKVFFSHVEKEKEKWLGVLFTLFDGGAFYALGALQFRKGE